ncbi:aspartate carbamoyltransferase [Herbidospora galbida]|uniref:Aspartate carbamoyltransferase n=1 Tax=Herbidospora galbida TaxID=2575442 RepID=A0A4V5UZZ0_9ACTN|nr:aspartate carbamoyltransferase [Herbidospora galbida]TKK90373.1 aspartate carbamoyltransferase [Herbidospora galbida]
MNLRNRRHLSIAGALALVVAAGVYVSVDQRDRQAEIAARSREVMPFDLETTTHRFAKSPSGGVQSVTSDDPGDSTQVTLIREHLTEETARFSRGDYGDPASIHGAEMPGLDRLRRGHEAIDVRYAELPTGAQITYRTTDASLITALHAWFDAQVTDHGRHAEHG